MYFFENKLCAHVILHSIYDYCKIALILYIVGNAFRVISYTVTKTYKIGHTVRTNNIVWPRIISIDGKEESQLDATITVY
jgi:hypothetical protein